ncbi:MAG: DUF1566 domain-containing protein [Methylococcaceae bacterium]
MVYDSDQNITWAADANLAKTLGNSGDGKMTWDAAVAWTSHLEIGGHNDWRLPATLSTVEGLNPAGSEMGHLFDASLAGAANNVHFSNIQDSNYWSGTQSDSNNADAWSFTIKAGNQITSAKTSRFYAWAVHNGDVGKMQQNTIPPVPVPAAIWLFGSGLIALLGVKRLGNFG